MCVKPQWKSSYYIRLYNKKTSWIGDPTKKLKNIITPKSPTRCGARSDAHSFSFDCAESLLAVNRIDVKYYFGLIRKTSRRPCCGRASFNREGINFFIIFYQYMIVPLFWWSWCGSVHCSVERPRSALRRCYSMDRYHWMTYNYYIYYAKL